MGDKATMGLRMRPPLWWTFFAITLSGCMAAEDGTVTSGPGATSTAEVQPPVSSDPGVSPTDTPPVPDEIPLAVAFTECRGMDTAYTFVGETNPGKPVSGWERTRGIGSDILIVGLACNRISWGAFERGPVHFLWEMHTNITTPADCRGGESTLSTNLHALWTDDRDLASFLNQTYGMATHVASFTVSDDRNGSVHLVKWLWAAEGHADSFLEFKQVVIDEVPTPMLLRAAWAQGTDLWLLDLDQVRIMTNGQTYAALGEFSPPTLYSQYAHSYYGTGAANLGTTASATLTRYGDHECKEPK